MLFYLSYLSLFVHFPSLFTYQGNKTDISCLHGLAFLLIFNILSRGDRKLKSTIDAGRKEGRQDSTNINTNDRTDQGRNEMFYLNMQSTHFIYCYMAFDMVGARCSSVVRAFAQDAMGRQIDPSWGGPIELFLVPASAPRLV